MPARLIAIMSLWLAFACAEPFDTARAGRLKLTAGGEIYAELCKRVASGDNPEDISGALSRDTCLYGAWPPAEGGPRLAALHAQRHRLVNALDLALTHDRVIDDLPELLTQMLPHYDDGLIQRQTRSAARALEILAASPAALGLLERIGAREGYRPARAAAGVARSLLAYPELGALARELAAAVGPGSAAEPSFRELAAALGAELENSASTLARADTGTLRLARDLLVCERDNLSLGYRLWVARRDARGVVYPARHNGALSAPFVDRDGDGLADVDVHGRFVDAAGQPVAVPPPFLVLGEPPSVARDPYGRLLDAEQRLVYEYIDTSRTLLATLLREFHTVLARDGDALLEAAADLGRALGPPTQQTYTYASGRTLQYTAFDLEQSGLVDLAHAVFQLADTDAAYWGLRLVAPLLSGHEPQAAAAAELALKVRDWLGEEPFAGVKLEPDTMMIDELIDLGAEVARVPGLLEDLLAALDNPDTRRLGDLLARAMRHRDRITYDPDDVNGPPLGSLVTPVDRSLPDLDHNQSAFQRFLHLVNDTNGATWCNRQGARIELVGIPVPLLGPYDECALLQVDNLGIFYVRSMIGRAQLQFDSAVVDAVADFDWALSTMAGIDGLTRFPKPRALNRMVFAPRNASMQALVDPALTADGEILEVEHADAIFIDEVDGFVEAMGPIVTAFDDHGRVDLLVELMCLLHRHYSSPASQTTQSSSPTGQDYSPQTGLVRFEEVAARMLSRAEGGTIDVLGDLAVALRETDTDGVRGDAVVVEAARQLLLPEWNRGLRNRQGRQWTLRSDGLTRVEELSPAWLVKDAVERLAAQLEGAGSGGAGLAAHFLAVQESFGVKRFQNRNVVPMAGIAIEFLAERVRAHALAGDVGPWSDGLTGRLERNLDEPLVAALVRLGETLVARDGTRAQVEQLGAYLLDELAPENVGSVTLASAADLLQRLEEAEQLAPLLMPLSELVNPDTGLMIPLVELLGGLQAVDSTGALPRLLAGIARRTDDAGGTVLETLVEVAFEVNRAAPGAGTELWSQDYGAVLQATRDFLTDETRGFERLYQLVAER